MKPLSATARKARLVRGFLQRRPVHCTWQLSPRCESFCHFCDHRAHGASAELDTAGCRVVAAGLGRIGTLLVTFTGSDPFLRGDLAEIVDAVSRRHFPLLVTNGWLVTGTTARAAWAAGLEAATVTVSDADPDRHDAATGQPGSHDRALEAVRTLARERTRPTQRVNVRTRLQDGDLTRLPALLEQAASLGAEVVVEAGYPLPRGNGAGAGLGRRLREIRSRHGNLRTGGRALGGLEQAFAEGVPGCLAGRAFFNVDHEGRLSKCMEFQDEADCVGSVWSEQAAALLGGLRRRHDENDCRACWYASRAEVEALYTVRGFVSGLGELVRG